MKKCEVEGEDQPREIQEDDNSTLEIESSFNRRRSQR